MKNVLLGILTFVMVFAGILCYKVWDAQRKDNANKERK